MKNSVMREKPIAGKPVHVIQHSYDWGVIFYDDVFILAHFTLFCTLAGQLGIKVYAITYMLNHIHMLVECKSLAVLRKFVQQVTTAFSKSYNSLMGRKGSLFSPFCFSIKATDKLFRSCHNYIANNGPEKGIVKRAIEYKWNFLAYALSPNPFSEKITRRSSSKELWKYVKIILGKYHNNQAISLQQLIVHKNSLNNIEWKKLVDFIVGAYNIIDYKSSSSFFGNSIDNMILSPDYNMGSEYEIDEDKLKYKPFYQMINLVNESKKAQNFRPFIMSEADIKKATIFFLRKTNADDYHISLFLHIPLEKVKEMFQRWIEEDSI